LTLADSVSVPSSIEAIWPACFPDINGQVYLRGHVTLDPVPAVGGSLLAVFPKNSQGQCACTPVPDAGTHDNNVITTTTALAYPRNTPNKPDVCIVRLLISLYLPVDVNLDLVVNKTDIDLVQRSPYYNFILSDPSTCPNNTEGFRDCGRVDVNRDGFVNQLDTTSIDQSANTTLGGLSAPCGGVFAIAFSCGSTRSAPLTPALGISLDSIVYFDNDGVHGTVTTRQRSVADIRVLGEILTDFEHLHTEVAALKGDVRAQDATLEQHTRALRHALPVNQREVLAGVSVAVGGIVLCGIMVYFIAKRR